MPSPQGEILGYATFPESAGLWNDGVVLGRRYVGKTGASAPFNLGRTATHEIGHYLNLRHIWGTVPDVLLTIVMILRYNQVQALEIRYIQNTELVAAYNVH